MSLRENSPMLMPGYVYGIECTPFIKIGVAQNISKRLVTIRLHNPFPCTVVFKRKTVAPYYFEKKMHEILKEQAIGREWFKTTIEEIKEAAKVATKFAKEVFETELKREMDWEKWKEQECRLHQSV